MALVDPTAPARVPTMPLPQVSPLNMKRRPTREYNAKEIFKIITPRIPVKQFVLMRQTTIDR